MSQKKSSIHCSIIFFVIVACLSTTIILIGVIYLPLSVEDTFGKPASGLSIPTRIVYSYLLLSNETDLTQPMNSAGEVQNFRIEDGESTLSVIQRLETEGFIKNAEAMRIYLLYSGLDTSLKAGTHQISPAMTALEIADSIQSLNRTVVDFSVLEGWRAEEIAASLPTSGLEITTEQFLASCEKFPQGTSFSAEFPANASCEGFLLPGIIQVPRVVSADQLILMLLQNFDQALSADLKAGFSRQGLSIYQAVTLASIVEREAVLDEEMPLIASVYLNRLSQDMKLDADPTVQYALGYQLSQKSWWANPLSAQDLTLDSPYNTYIYPGLPPGPIANPGLEALKAVSNPQSSPYFYFQSACDKSGKHVFAQTFAEHLANSCP